MGSPKSREAHGDGVTIVVVEVIRLVYAITADQARCDDDGREDLVCSDTRSCFSDK